MLRAVSHKIIIRVDRVAIDETFRFSIHRVREVDSRFQPLVHLALTSTS